MNGSKKWGSPFGGEPRGGVGAVLCRVNATGEVLREELAEWGGLGTASRSFVWGISAECLIFPAGFAPAGIGGSFFVVP